MAKRNWDRLHDILVGDDEGRLCEDIPESACRHQPRNILIHVLALAATKTGDGLADPKLVIAWLLGSIGASATVIGLLVPVREALSLLPQLFTAAQIRAVPVRKHIWIAGSVVQGLAVMGMALAGIMLEGDAGGWTILALLALFAVARSACSISYKDVLGKTVAKGSRGTATGTAGSLAAIVILAFGLSVSLGVLPLTAASICAVLAIAGVLWIVAAAGFSSLAEEPGATGGGANALSAALGQFHLLREDSQLRRFIAVRALLIPTALAPPFMLAISGRNEDAGMAGLGTFVIASSLAAFFSAYVWGRLADRSSRLVLLFAALGGAFATGAAGMSGLSGSGVGGHPLVMPALLFALMVAYQGVRLGRSTHIVDMTDQDRRASYTALSNTIIGLLLAAGGVFGLIADIAGGEVVLIVFSLICLMAAWAALGLEEVQSTAR